MTTHNQDPTRLCDHELLAQVTGLSEDACKSICDKGNLAELFFGSQEMRYEGVDRLEIQALHKLLEPYKELHRRSSIATMRTGIVLNQVDMFKIYLSLRYSNESVESFHVLFLDPQHRLIKNRSFGSGGIAHCPVDVKEITRAALLCRAQSVVLAHNHPSGDLTSSEADKRMTQSLRAALALIDVRVIDHVIVGNGQALSMLETGQF